MNPIDSYDGQRVYVRVPGAPERIGTVVFHERTDLPKDVARKIRVRFEGEKRPRNRFWAAHVFPIPSQDKIIEATLQAFSKAPPLVWS